jgi:ketosteroid isomerase-like protein
MLAACDRRTEAAGSPAAAAAPAQKAAVEAATAALHQALRTNNSEVFLSYVDNGVIMAPPDEQPVKGKAALRAWYQAFLAKYRTSSLSLTDKEVFVGNGWAVEFGRFEWALAPTDGTGPVVDRGTYMQVWKQQPDGQWRFAREVWNSSAQPS